MQMQKYIGVKIVEAVVMSRGEWLHSRCLRFDDSDAAAAGYRVTYPDGYVSWCPKASFEEANRPVTGMCFGHAIEALKKGLRVCRAGWNGKGMWIVLMSGMTLPSFNDQTTDRKVNDRTAKWIGPDTPLETLPYIAMWTVAAGGRRAWLPGWLASQTDMLADDWMVVE